MARCTDSWLADVTGNPFTTRDTVARDTPARAATLSSVGRRWSGFTYRTSFLVVLRAL
jgi:hypothetical protein